MLIRVALGLGLAINIAPAQAQETKPPIDGIAAIVGDKIILKSEVAQYLNMSVLQQQLDPRKDMDKIDALKKEIIQTLVDQKVILAMAILDSIEVDDKSVDRAMDQRIERFLAQAGGEEAAEKALGQPLRSYRREFWYDMRDVLLTDTYRQQLVSKLSVNRDDVITFFETFKDSIPLFPSMAKTRHLLIKIKPGQKEIEKTISLLKRIKEQLLAGDSFEALAKQYSQDPGSRKNGGSLGFVRRGNLVPEFESRAFTLLPGEISDPVKTVFGYHLIQTEEILGEKIKVRHILITPQTTEEDDSQAYVFAKTLKDSIKSLDDFIRLVKKHTEDEETKETGGSLGWIEPSQYPIPQIGMAINQINTGICGGPVNSEAGYHLLWIETIKPGGKPSLKNHWPELESMALNNKTSKWYQTWVSAARKKVFISIQD